MFDNQHHKVLVTEDESLVADLISRKLEAGGLVVTVARNGQEALDQLAKNKYDLLLMDLTMPDLDGFQLLSRLKTQKNTMPIIVMSNLSQAEDVKKAKALGAWNYIIKANVTPTEIVEKVEQCILEHKC